MAVKEPTGGLKKACWKGYTAVGMKMKNGRKVPNCVPVKAGRAMAKEEIEQIEEGPQRDKTRAMNKLKDAIAGANYRKSGMPAPGLDTKRKTPQALNKAIGRGLRKMGEEVEQMDESTVAALDAIRQFASRAHEDWRKTLPAEERDKPRMRSKNGGPMADINVPFHKLHPSAQKENLDAGKAAFRAVVNHGTDTEAAAEHVHKEWMKRNPKSDYNAHQHVPYHGLPEDEKQKDRDHVITMRSILSSKRKTKLGEANQMEEVEQMDELSRNTLRDYVGKAYADRKGRKGKNTVAAITGTLDDYLKGAKKSDNRSTGITRAYARLNKEEVMSPQGDEPTPSHYNIVHRDSKRVVGTATTIKRARSARDRHDNKYGSYAHSIVPVFKEEVEQMNEKHLTPAERKKREEIAQAMERKSPGMDMGKKMAIATAQAKKVAEGYGPKRYGSREDDFGHEAPDRDHVHSEPKDHGLTVHNHEGKEIGTVPKHHFEPMTLAMYIAMKHSRATGENTEVRRFGKKVESFKGKKVNESKNIIREVIRKAVDKQGTNKANGKTATGAPAAKVQINPSIDLGPNKRGIGGT